MDEAEREAAYRMLEEENVRVRKYLKRRLARRKPPSPEALERFRETMRRHEEVVDMIRAHREARLRAEAGG